MRRFLFLAYAVAATVAFSQTTDPRLSKFLEKFPEADLDGDGTLTMDEANAFRKQMRQGQKPSHDSRTEPKPPGKRYSMEELAEVFEKEEFDGMPFRFFKPETEEGKRYPLVLSLHGAGGKGNDNRKNLKPWLGPLTEDSFQEKHPCFIVAPQSPEAWRIPGSEPEMTTERIASFPEIWQTVMKDRGGFVAPVSDGKLKAVFELLDQLATDFPVDTDRVYVLGHSMGGFGTFEALAIEPKRFAAAIPSAGGLSPWHDPTTFKDVPIWAFHGSEDRTVIPGLTQYVFDQMTKANGRMKFTTLGGIGHGAAGWAFIYEGDSMNPGFSTSLSSKDCDPTEDVWEWLFSKKRG